MKLQSSLGSGVACSWVWVLEGGAAVGGDAVSPIEHPWVLAKSMGVALGGEHCCGTGSGEVPWGWGRR